MTADLSEIVLNNLEYFQRAEVKSGQRLHQLFQHLSEVLEKIKPIITKFELFVKDYDFNDATPGNGYRSFLFVLDSAVKCSLRNCVNVKENREKFFFRKSFYEKEIAAYNDVLDCLLTIGCNLIESHDKSSRTSLFSEEGIYRNTIVTTMESIKLESFYGRAFGFQLPPSIKSIAKQLGAIAMTYSEFYFSGEHKFLKCLRLPHTLVKYFLNEELLSKRFVDTSNNAGIDFCKALMMLAESNAYGIFQYISELKVCVNRVFHIPMDPLKVRSTKHGNLVDVPIPKILDDAKALHCRLFSATRRKGMFFTSKSENKSEAPPSKHLILHLHGGGWMSQSSKFHGSYLKYWAAKLDVPILSVDYSLAPEAPFPRALEEVFYAYCWIRNNSELLGSTGEKIVLVGDSAGANLIAACVIKCIEMDVPTPQGLLGIYGVFYSNFVMAPSRVMGLMDVILPFTSHMRLFPSYRGITQESKIEENRKIPKAPGDEFDVELSNHYLISPFCAPDDILRKFPKTYLLSTNLDPCLDESVEFAKKLQTLEIDVHLDVLEGLNHGFLNCSPLSGECRRGTKLCMQRIAELLEVD